MRNVMNYILVCFSSLWSGMEYDILYWKVDNYLNSSDFYEIDLCYHSDHSTCYDYIKSDDLESGILLLRKKNKFCIIHEIIDMSGIDMLMKIEKKE